MRHSNRRAARTRRAEDRGARTRRVLRRRTRFTALTWAAVLSVPTVATVLATAAVHPTPASAASPGWTVVVANDLSTSDSVTAISTASNTASSPVAVGSLPLGVAVTPDGRTALVVNVGSGSITPLDLTTTPPTAAAPVNVGGPGDNFIAVTPDGTRAFVADAASTTVTPLDLTVKPPAAGTAIQVGNNPEGVAVSPDGTMVYVANRGDGTVTPIVIATGTALTPISVGAVPFELAITPDGTTLYVTNATPTNTVTKVTLATDATTTITGVGVNPTGIAITPDGTMAYVADDGANTVTPITLTGPGAPTVGTPLSVPNGATATDSTAWVFALAVTPDGKTLYAADGGSPVLSAYGNTVTPFDLTTTPPTAGTPITVGQDPRGVVVTPDQAPAAGFSVTPGAVGTATMFDASSSSAPVGGIASYAWDFGDGAAPTTTTVPTVSHTYTAANTYTATLTVTDTAGTSTARVSTGTTMLRNGGPTAVTSHAVTVASQTAPRPAVTAVTPGFGPPAGGSTVTVTGTNLGGATAVDFGTFAGTVTTDTTTSITVTAPPGAPGAVAVTVTGPGGTSLLTPSDSYTYETAPLSGTVVDALGTLVPGALVQVCATGGGACSTTTTDASGAWTLQVSPLPGTTDAVTAFPPAIGTGSVAAPGTRSPITVSGPAGVSGIAITLAPPPVLAAGITITSPNYGVQTSTTATPNLYWREPFQITIDPSMFPAGTTIVVTQIVVRGIDLSTGLPATRVVDVGGTVGGTPTGLVLGSTPLSIAMPPLAPLHGETTFTINYQSYAAGSQPPAGVTATPVLDLASPNPIGAPPTDTATAWLTNYANPTGISLGGGAITGTDAADFTILPLVGFPDCGTGVVQLTAEYTGSPSTPPPSTRCGATVQFHPSGTKIYETAILDVNSPTGPVPVTLDGCDSNLAAAAGLEGCFIGTGGELEPFPGPNGGSVYVDPSGTVTTAGPHGPVPVAGATVTLEQSSAGGPFQPVPSGSAVMSPANRVNPGITGGTGSFGWDVLAGTYQVDATAPGCTPTASPTLLVPPAAVGLDLSLTCASPPAQAVTTTTVAATPPTSSYGQPVTLKATVGAAAPSGSVTFTDGATPIGQAVVTGGTATLVTSSLALGAHQIGAGYSGDGANATSVAVAVSEVISAAAASGIDLGLAVSGPSRVGPRQMAEYAFSVTDTGPATTTPITVTANLPSGASYRGHEGAGWRCQASGAVVTCNHAGPLRHGQHTVVRLTVQVSAPAGSTLVIKGTVTPLDATRADNAASITSKVQRDR